MLDKKQIQTIFLFEFRMGCKATETLTTSTTHLAEKLLTKIWCSGNSRRSIKEIRALKMRSIVASHQMLTMTNWEQSSKLILLQLTQEFAELNVYHSVIVQHSKQIRKAKRLNKWVPHELTKKKKKTCLFDVSSSLIYATTTNHFSVGLWCVMKSGFYTTGHDHLSGWAQKKLQSTSQSQTFIKKNNVHCLLVCCPSDPYSFLKPGKAIMSEKYAHQIDEMHKKPQCL